MLSITCCECDAMIIEAHIVNNASLKFHADGPLSCEEHAEARFCTLYFEENLYVICTECDRPVTVLEVQSYSEPSPEELPN